MSNSIHGSCADPEAIETFKLCDVDEHRPKSSTLSSLYQSLTGQPSFHINGLTEGELIVLFLHTVDTFQTLI